MVLHGENIHQDGNSEYRLSYEVTDDGTLEDRFFLKSGDEWKRRHLIVMKTAEDNE